MRLTHIAALSTFLATALPTPALADAATHQLRLTARNVGSQCVVSGTLTNLRRASPPLEIALVYSPTRNGEPEAQMTLSFPKLATGTRESTVDHAPFRCSRVTVRKVEVTCPEARDRCPGFFYVQVPALRAPRLAAQKVEGR